MSGSAVIHGAVRTPIGSFMGALKDVSAVDMGALVIKEAIQRAGLAEKDIDEVIMGNVLQAGAGQNPARIAALKAGLPETVPATTINKLCGSGLKAVHMAVQAIAAGDADIIVAGGMENMSQAPYLQMNARGGFAMGDQRLMDSMLHDGLTCAIVGHHMGVTAENINKKYQFTREQQDRFACSSQEKAGQANEQGIFKEEIIKVEVPKRKGPPVLVEEDEYIRNGTTMETLGRLKPAFEKEGSVTAGNTSGINDGAGAVVVMSEQKAAELGLTPMVRVVSNASAAVDPAIMGTGPIPAVKKALEKGKLTIEDMDIIEANEAFAAQALAVQKDLSIDEKKLNVNGGAIALGHPIGASGARILVTLLYQMKRDELDKGLAALCIGGGQGVATIVEKF
ncbi:acetyl-CoA C-acetyltransferase [Sinobaca sp. H24]|uniref:acetyl-CoA C-acetyltransferase n=1 Tax=Sinobaca sp. H24 TaxID=2923376 RepID=UPI002079DCC2|nr:acetyl-CoA C-acetyltransferase [Sinobaca sp. H24]